MAVRTISHYQLIEKIGAGGMGVVYRAWDEKLRRDVALKFLPRDTKTRPSARDLLMREARSASCLNHPSICTIYEVSEENGEVFIAMEYVAGRTLFSAIPVQGLPFEIVIHLGTQIADALDHAHAHKIIHRDLKTQNVVVTPEGRAKVLDFGLAQHRAGELEETTQSEKPLAQGGGFAGTLPYMAPELLRGAPADARSDIWALGVLLYEMVTGTRPFRGETGFIITSEILTKSPAPWPQQVPPGLRAAIGRCLLKDPGQRFQHAAELRAVLEVISSSAESPSIVPAVPDARPDAQVPYDSGRRWPRRLLALGCLTVALALTYWAVKTSRLRERFLGVQTPHYIQSIAVLPLANLSVDPQQDYFADGMTEELIYALSRVSALRVTSRASVMKYKGLPKPVAEIARELNVDAVVEGTVQRSDGRVKISAELVDTRADRNLWGHTYEGDLRDILNLQSQVAQTIAEEIQVQLTPEESANMSKTRLVNPQAYETYLRGRYLWNKRTSQDLRSALEEFKKAIDQDPTSALAWSGLADGYTLLASQGEMPPREAMPLAWEAAKNALQLDDSLAQAHASLAVIEWTYDWNKAGAGAEFARSIILNPSYATAREWHGLYLSYTRRFDEGLVEMRRAQDLDPFSRVIQVNVARCFYYARNYDKATEMLNQFEQQEPNFWMVPAGLGQTYLANGRFDDAIRELERARTLFPSAVRNLGVLGDAYGRAGRRGDALKIAAELDTLSQTQYVLPIYSALIYIGIGDKTRAFAFLDKAYTDRSEWMMELEVEPEFDPLRSDPRFQALLRRVAESGRSSPREVTAALRSVAARRFGTVVGALDIFTPLNLQ